MQVSKWGNSLAVRLPAKLVAELGLKEGDEIELHPRSAGVIDVEKRDRVQQLMEAFAPFRGSLPADYKFNREELYDRGPDVAD